MEVRDADQTTAMTVKGLDMANEIITVKELLYVIFKRKFTLLFFGLSFIAAAFTILSIMTPRYLITSSIYLEREGKERASIFPTDSGGVLRESEEDINSEVEIIKSHPVLENVARDHPDLEDILNRDPSSFRRACKYPFRLYSQLKEVFIERMYIYGLRRRPSPEEMAFFALGERIGLLRNTKFLRVEPVRNSDIIEVKLYAANPNKAVPILDDLVNHYFAHRLKVEQLPKAGSFFDEQIQLSRQKLSQLRASLSDYQKKQNMISYDRQEAILFGKYSKFDSAYTQVNKDIVSQEAKMMKMKELLQSNRNTVIPSLDIFQMSSIDRIYSRLVELKITRATLSIKYTLEDRLMRDNMIEIMEIEKKLRDEVLGMIQLHENSLDALKAERKALEGTLIMLTRELGELPDKRDTIKRLEQAVMEEANTLSLLIKKRDDERVSAAKDNRVINLRVVSPASFNIYPVKPKTSFYLTIAFAAALFGSLALIFTLEFMDHTIKRSEDVSQYVGLPVIGSVPEV